MLAGIVFKQRREHGCVSEELKARGTKICHRSLGKILRVSQVRYSGSRLWKNT